MDCVKSLLLMGASLGMRVIADVIGSAYNLKVSLF